MARRGGDTIRTLTDTMQARCPWSVLFGCADDGWLAAAGVCDSCQPASSPSWQPVLATTFATEPHLKHKVQNLHG